VILTFYLNLLVMLIAKYEKAGVVLLIKTLEAFVLKNVETERLLEMNCVII